MTKKISLLLSVSLLLIVGCNNPFTSSDDSNEQTPIIEYKFDDEAEIMASWYYELLEAPDSTAHRIYNDMSLIDDLYKDTIAKWSYHVRGSLHPDYSVKYLKFIPPWKMSQIRFKFSSTVDSNLNLFYDSLKTLTHDSLIFVSSNYYDAYLYLTGVQNSLNAARIFKLNSAIDEIGLKPHIEIGEYSNIFPYFENGQSKYFYTFLWGDCPSGCMNAEIYYFEIKNNNAVLVGQYNSWPYPTILPDWIDTFQTARQKLKYNWWEELN